MEQYREINGEYSIPEEMHQATSGMRSTGPTPGTTTLASCATSPKSSNITDINTVLKDPGVDSEVAPLMDTDMVVKEEKMDSEPSSLASKQEEDLATEPMEGVKEEEEEEEEGQGGEEEAMEIVEEKVKEDKDNVSATADGEGEIKEAGPSSKGEGSKCCLDF